MIKATVIGHFGNGLEYYDGQTVKTKKVTKELDSCFGENTIKKIDTHGGIKALLRAPIDVLLAASCSENIIVLPAQNGLKVYAPLLRLAKLLYKVKIHYVVIGGWLGEIIKNKNMLRKNLTFFDGIYVETNTLKRALESQGFLNVYILPNFKEEQHVPLLPTETKRPFRLCTFSRVMKEKGIEDAIDAVNIINASYDQAIYSLDIYGPIDEQQEQWFNCIKQKFGKLIKYKGSIPTEESTNIIKDYFALLLPTHFYTEGIPGTIIDSYAAGVPVICSKWESFSDIVEEGVTGIGYDFNSENGLLDSLKYANDYPEEILKMKEKCVNKFREYTPSVAMQALISHM